MTMAGRTDSATRHPLRTRASRFWTTGGGFGGSTRADPHAEGEVTSHAIVGCFQLESHPVTGGDVGTVNVNLPHVQRRPSFRSLDHPVDDRTDRFIAHQIVVEPQVVDPGIAQLLEERLRFL